MDEKVRRYPRIIMGIDPGTNVLGYGILGIDGKRAEVVVAGVLQLSKFESHYKRLHRIYERVTQLIDQYLPDELAIEAPFCGKNVQSMLKLGRAQGVAMVAALNRDIPVTEYAPMAIKQSVTGSGAASKEQVARMVQNILRIPAADMPSFFDATDALAAALTHHYEAGKPRLEKGASSWAAFIARNPDRVARK